MGINLRCCDRTMPEKLLNVSYIHVFVVEIGCESMSEHNFRTNKLKIEVEKMKGESNTLRGQLKGYLFEMIISELLKKNGFKEIDTYSEPKDRVRETRKGFIELKGRGCWHQIDCPFDYNRTVPFSFPLRILGEVKFYKSPINKKFIREYIGVMRDIQENYFVFDRTNFKDIYPRKMEIGVYFSANGFQEEAEKLAYAHGIKTISYSNNCIIDNLKKLVEDLEESFISVECMKSGVWSDFRKIFKNIIHNGHYEVFDVNYEYILKDYVVEDYISAIYRIYETLNNIKSSFIATTVTGVFIHFVGPEEFPKELFSETDFGKCRVFYGFDNSGKRYFYMTIIGDQKNRKFYFTPPESLDEAAVFGNREVLNEKERLFAQLNVNIEINCVSRNLVLSIDREWLYETL